MVHGSGDHDMCVPFTGSEAWTRSLGYKIVDEWRPWNLNDQVAGYAFINIINKVLQLNMIQISMININYGQLFEMALHRYLQEYENNLTFLTIKVSQLNYHLLVMTPGHVSSTACLVSDMYQTPTLIRHVSVKYPI